MTAVLAGVELESLAEVDARLRAGRSLAGTYIQSVDLTGHGPDLLAAGVTGAVFLGCTFEPEEEARLIASGALVFPRLPDLPFAAYRSGLYRPEELYAGLDRGYSNTFDARVYQWWCRTGTQRDLGQELGMTLHDHAIVDALVDLDLTAAVGVMGGHRLERDNPHYAEAAHLGRDLVAAGHPVLTGGGPGAMEAVSLGAALEGSAADLARAIALLAAHPRFDTDTDAWANAAFEVRRRYRLGGPSIGIPTWVYGHEPANAFAHQIAKLFSNAIREDVLLRLSTGGLVCLPGAAGTVQEIFQALTPRYYAGDGPIPPLVLVGAEHWERIVPAWPLVQALARRRRMARRLHLVDSVDEVLDLLEA